MIILTKKKIAYLVGIICVVLFLYLIVRGTISKKNSKLNSIQTVSLPVNKRVIILDAGHGKPDERC